MSTLKSSFDIAEALSQMRAGSSVRRAGWMDQTMTIGLINLPFAFWQATGTFPDVTIVRWDPKADDLLFTDWVVVAPGRAA